MPAIDRVSTLLRSLFTMNPSALPTEEQLNARTADALAKRDEARAELAATEAELAEASAAAGIDDLTLKRLDKKLEEARAKVRRWDEQLDRLSVLAEQRIKASFRERQREQLARAEAIASEAVKAAAEIDRHSEALASALERINGLHVQFIATLPERPADIPPALTQSTLAYLVSAKIFALCGESWALGVKQRMTRYEARQFPSIEARIKNARSLVLSKMAPAGPEAA